MKSSHLPARHAKDHFDGGYDPIPGIIRFDFLNTGGYLSIDASEFIALLADADIDLTAGDDIHITVSGSGGTITVGNGTTMFFVSEGSAFTQGRSIDHRILDPIGGEIIPGFSVTGTGTDREWMQIEEDGQHMHRLGAGNTLLVLDSAYDPIMRLDEDGTLHLKTGATIVSDL